MVFLSTKGMPDAFPHIDVVISMLCVVAFWSLVVAFVLYALFGAAVDRKVKRLRREEESRRSREHASALEQAQQCMYALAQGCFEIGVSMLNGGTQAQEGKEQSLLLFPVAQQVSASLRVELEALERVLEHFQRLLWQGIVPAQLECFQEWYDDLRRRFEEACCEASLALRPSVVEALKADAKEVWRDTIAFTQTSKPTLLECLQNSVTQGKIAFAAAARTLARQGSDAWWDASGHYRRSLIHWAACDAMRRILRAREVDQNLDDAFTVEMHYLEFALALARKCDDDQVALFQALHVDKHPDLEESRVALTA